MKVPGKLMMLVIQNYWNSTTMKILKKALGNFRNSPGQLWN